MTRIPQETEAQFQGAVVKLARLMGYTTYHTHDSYRSDPGFPDLLMCRPPRVIAAELKSKGGKVAPAQQSWLDLLAACGVEVYVWRPADWPSVMEALR